MTPPAERESPLVDIFLDFSEVAQTRLPCGSTVPAFFCQYQAKNPPKGAPTGRDLLLGIDGLELSTVEEIARELLEIGVSLVPLPLAPTKADFSPTRQSPHRSWPLPDEGDIKTRAEGVRNRQVAGFVQLFFHQETWNQLAWVPGEGDGPLCEQVRGCLKEVLCPE